MTSRARLQRIHPAWWTTILVGVIALFLWLCSASFVGAMTSSVPVTLTSDRAGLVMESGSKVKLRGVQVGEVAGVEGGQQQVRLKLKLFPDQIQYIPANVGSEIRATTIFGAKYVDLIYPDHPSPQHISAGAVLASRNVSTEVNTVFQNLVDVLHQIDPAKLNAVLTAVAEGVGGRGERIGEATTATNHVLLAINPRMNTVGSDWHSLKQFSDAYSAAAPDILATLNAASTVSATITNQTTDLDALLVNVIGLSQAGIDVVGPNRDNLVHAINVLKPTTNLLMKYNPEYTCLLMGAKWWLDNGGYEVMGGNGRTIMLDSALLLGDDPYQYPDNLPIVAAKGGPGGKPGCGSLPDASKAYPVRQLITNTGWGTGLDIRPNPGIGHPCWVDFLPVTRGAPQHPSIRQCIPGPAPGPAPPLGAPPYGAPLYPPTGDAPILPPAVPALPAESPTP
ncbi:MCE family protein [Mycobacterium vicinigordonae]|uniref:MCE family protein n=1 Tax=Mycobacterium vicinigordonae TaxID=1719132 RepID=A0A7D6DW08_9MYCO|nr:MCE family protein [Mycobacterium vicinigordonae]QLL06147.1 MCE family protein [Mycobacterium vicinigordonae]